MDDMIIVINTKGKHLYAYSHLTSVFFQIQLKLSCISFEIRIMYETCTI